MCDGAELADALAAHPDDFEAGLEAYEQALFARMSQADDVMNQHLEETFGDDIPEALRALMPEHQQDN
ncbi:hypothetical protein GCM10020001_087510 [Nonomuraea salmonea]